MTVTSLLKLSPLLLAFWGAAAAAQGQGSEKEEGATSGPAYGTNVEPNTVIQKQTTGRSGATRDEWKASSEAAGAPGIEGKPDTESGPPAQEQTAPPISK